jgi:hypothetical protein
MKIRRVDFIVLDCDPLPAISSLREGASITSLGGQICPSREKAIPYASLKEQGGRIDKKKIN